MGYSSDKKSFK